MSTHPNAVRCPWCGAQPSEPCSVPAGPGQKKKLFHRSPLRLTAAHPSRIEAAMKLDGAGEGEIERHVAGHLAAAASKYRELPGCARMPDLPTPTTPPQADPPERPAAVQPAAKDDVSQGVDA